ncbi:hypothetical protein BDW75DRAFT_107952 [Aspergillus navahoensis]
MCIRIGQTGVSSSSSKAVINRPMDYRQTWAQYPANDDTSNSDEAVTASPVVAFAAYSIPTELINEVDEVITRALGGIFTSIRGLLRLPGAARQTEKKDGRAVSKYSRIHALHQQPGPRHGAGDSDCHFC